LLFVFSCAKFFIMKTPVEKACDIAGGQASLANKLGVTTPTVNQWVSNHRPVPIKQCVAIEKITGGAVSRKDLRPDDWEKIWPELTEAA
jgi:DNA-binding transcriptional regulator YdaS (Cro superfamily)